LKPKLLSIRGKPISAGSSCSFLILAGLAAPLMCAQAPNAGTSPTRVPAGVILVKGAWASASDAMMPVPEGAIVLNGLFRDRYFGISYTSPAGWTESYKGPPPSDSGRYVLTQLIPGATLKGRVQGSILFTAQDMFFTPMPASTATELIGYMKENLQAGYEVEVPLAQTTIAGRTFASFGYWSPVARLHWYVLAIQIRCHVVEIVLTSRDPVLLKSLIQDMNKMELPVEAGLVGGSGGGAVPVCINDYARDENLIAKVDPILTEHRFNPVPVRIIIDTTGKVKHIHFLSAFDDQATAITDALGKWRFKPYQQNNRPVEVETGILFGRTSQAAGPGKPRQ
jgi:hypothetical protein